MAYFYSLTANTYLSSAYEFAVYTSYAPVAQDAGWTLDFASGSLDSKNPKNGRLTSPSGLQIIMGYYINGSSAYMSYAVGYGSRLDAANGQWELKAPAVAHARTKSLASTGYATGDAAGGYWKQSTLMSPTVTRGEMSTSVGCAGSTEYYAAIIGPDSWIATSLTSSFSSQIITQADPINNDAATPYPAVRYAGNGVWATCGEPTSTNSSTEQALIAYEVVDPFVATQLLAPRTSVSKASGAGWALFPTFIASKRNYSDTSHIRARVRGVYSMYTNSPFTSSNGYYYVNVGNRYFLPINSRVIDAATQVPGTAPTTRYLLVECGRDYLVSDYKSAYPLGEGYLVEDYQYDDVTHGQFWPYRQSSDVKLGR